MKEDPEMYGPETYHERVRLEQVRGAGYIRLELANGDATWLDAAHAAWLAAQLTAVAEALRTTRRQEDAEA